MLPSTVITPSGIDLYPLWILKSAALESGKGTQLPKMQGLCTRNLYILRWKENLTLQKTELKKKTYIHSYCAFTNVEIVCGHTKAAHHTNFMGFSKKCFPSNRRATILFLKTPLHPTEFKYNPF